MSTFLESIERWFYDFRKYFFYYRDGFFELPFLGNSPQLTFETAIKMPFHTYSKSEQKITTNNPIMSGEMHFQEIETGLVITVLDLKIKANCNFKAIYDKYFPKEYFLLTFQVNKNPYPTAAGFYNHHTYSFKTWEFYKPAGFQNAYIFKGTNALFINIYIHKQWMQQKLSEIENAHYKVLDLFFNSNSKQIIIPEQLENSEEFYTSIFETISLKAEQGVKDPQKLSRLILDFVDIFLTKIKEEHIGIEHFDIPDIDRKKVQIIEKVLTDNLFTAFPGIENMAKEIEFSESKLKILFKLIYGNTLFQYYREKQLMLAKLMLESDDKKINEIAFLFGYENAGKFSVAFKNQFGVLPSEL